MFDNFFEPKTWLKLGLFCLIVGVFVLKSAFALMIDQNKANSWPTTKGRVDEVEVVRLSDKEFYPEVSYTYNVGTKTHTGKTVWLGAPITFPNLAQATAAAPGMGAMAVVHYDPSDPDTCTLRTDGRAGLLSTSSGRWGVSLAAAGLLCLLIAFFKNRAMESWHTA